MELKIFFKELEKKIDVGFGEIAEISDGGYERGVIEGFENAKKSLTELSAIENGEYMPDSKSIGFSKVNVNIDTQSFYEKGYENGVKDGFLDGQKQGYDYAVSKLTDIEIAENGNYYPSDENIGFNLVKVKVAFKAPEKKEIDFIDYDGTLLHSFSVEEVKRLTDLPELPTQKGLICQGWNWSLVDLQNYIAKMEENNLPIYKITIGAMYITDDEKTRIYISLKDGRLSPTLGFATNGTVIIDWGDETDKLTVSGTSTSTIINNQHNYQQEGDYVIALEVVSGNLNIVGSSTYGSRLIYSLISSRNKNAVYQNSIQKIELGRGVTSIGTYAFNNCYSLASATIPNSVTSIGSSAFDNGYSLASVTIPNSVTSIGSYAFYNGHSLASVTIPNSVTSIRDYAFAQCDSLASATIPNSVTSIGGSTFNSCYSLVSVAIPNSVTSIGTYAFYNCYSLASVTIPNSVTSIGSSAFYNCYGVAFYDFSTHERIPTLANTAAFSGIASDCEIRVPIALVDEWKNATNWSNYANYIVGV